MPPVDQILSQPVVRVYKSSATSKFFGPLPQGERRGFVTENFKPIDSFDPDRRNVMQAKQGDLQPVQFKVLQRLTTVIAQAAAGNGSTIDEIFADLQVGGKFVPGPMTMRQFMALKSYEQVNVIDQAWNKVCHKRGL